MILVVRYPVAYVEASRYQCWVTIMDYPDSVGLRKCIVET